MKQVFESVYKLYFNQFFYLFSLLQDFSSPCRCDPSVRPLTQSLYYFQEPGCVLAGSWAPLSTLTAPPRNDPITPVLPGDVTLVLVTLPLWICSR